MKAFLEVLLPKIAPQMQFVLVPHEGKQDLDRSIPRKLRAWRTPGTKFVIVRDRDSADCRELKKALQSLIPEVRRCDTLVRIACRELESWILGDLAAVAHAYAIPDGASLTARQKFRDPDELGNPAEELRKLIPAYQKVSGARRVAQFFEPARNASHSFGVFASAVRRLATEGCGVNHETKGC